VITAFVWALRDHPDATLVLHMSARPGESGPDTEVGPDADAGAIYRQLAMIPHQCRVIQLTGDMSDVQARELAAQTTYYVNATRAESCCLHLQEMLAAGRPALSPIHTAMKDFFDESIGFVVESHPEPCPFPGDAIGPLRTTWHRLVWQSLHDQLQASYALAHDPEAYQALAERARQRMREYASLDSVLPRLAEALDVALAAPPPALREAPAQGRSRTEAGARRELLAPLCIDGATMACKEMTGIGRYVALLIQYLVRSREVCVLIPGAEIPVTATSLPERVADLYSWRDALFRLPKQPPGAARVREGTCILPFVSSGERRFSREIGIVHDLSPLVVAGVASEPQRREFAQYCRRQLPALDGILCDSQATRADVAWLARLDAAGIEVAYPGPSLCLAGHAWTRPVRRSSSLLLAVGVHHPRKNAQFLFDWFWNTPALPPEMELWWAGPNHAASRAALQPRNNLFGRRVRLLGLISDADLCRLYQTARCLIYPSLYEGFGFPVLDALLHGSQVLCGRHSSLIEFEGPGVYYFDPCDPASLDRAFLDLCASDPVPVQREDLRARCTWEGLAAAVSRLCA
jgi:glycosyltransferase involved in cell wall biosynthesis